MIAVAVPSENSVGLRVVLGVGICAALAGFALGRFNAPATSLISSVVKGEGPATRTHAAKRERDARTELGDVRIDQLGHVPLDEVRELLMNRDASELAQTARKFDHFSPNPLTYSNLRPFFRAWAQMDEVAALQSALAFKDDRMRGISIGEIADSVSPEAAGRLIPLLRQLRENSFKPSVRDGLLGMAVVNWSQSNPVEAAEILLEETALRKTCGPYVLRNWGWIEGSAALAWLNAKPSTISSDATAEFSAVMRGWVENDPSEASSYVASHLDDPRASGSIGEMASNLFFIDKTLSMGWAEKLPAGQLRAQAKAEIAKVYAQDNPTEAAEWTARSYAADGDEAFTAAINSWREKDPEAALVWINSQAGSLRDSALATYCAEATRIPPQKVVAVALTMTDVQSRDSVVRMLLSNWLETSAEEATAWIRSSNLSAREKTELLKQASSVPP